MDGTGSRGQILAASALVGGLALSPLSASATGAGPIVAHHQLVAASHHHTPRVTAISPKIGPTAGGNTVTIRGRHFKHVKAVKFGTKRAHHVHVKSSRRITVHAPKHGAGTVHVRVKTSTGTSAKTKAARYTYVAAPSITTVSPASGRTAGGTTVTIIGRNLGHLTAVSFGATRAKVLTATTSRLVVVAPKHAAATVDIRITTAGGRSKTAPFDRYSYWDFVAAPLPSDADSDPTVVGRAAACDAPGSCRVVGFYYVDPGHYRPFVESLFDGIWTSRAAPTPAGGTPYGSLGNIACPTAGSCIAAGAYYDSSNYSHPMIDTLSKGSWSAVHLPEPANESATPFFTIGTLHCVSVTSCVAAGYYTDNGGHQQGLIETLSGSTWSAITAPLPGDAGTSPNVHLERAFCVSTSSCIIVGYYVDASGHSQGLIDTLSSGTWTAIQAPLPAAATGDPLLAFGGIDCPTTTTCIAAGSYADNDGHFQELVETLSGGTWSAINAPLPADAGTDPSAGIEAIHCTAADACVLTGDYQDTDAHYQTNVDTLASGTWTAVKAAAPADADADPETVSHLICRAGGSCLIAGSYIDSALHHQPLVGRASATGWTLTRLPTPSDAAADPVADNESGACDGTGFCFGFGRYTRTDGGRFPLIERLS